MIVCALCGGDERHLCIKPLEKNVVMRMKSYVFLLLCFVSLHAVEGYHDLEWDFYTPQKKKIKLDVRKGARVLVRSGCKSQMILKTIETYKEEGCPAEVLSDFLRPSRKGVKAVLESVVDTMFKENVDIEYNEFENKYWLLGPAPVLNPQPHIGIEMARIMTQANPEDVAKNLGNLGYRLFKLGCRTENYYRFARIYYAVRAFCCYNLAESMSFVKDFVDFFEEDAMYEESRFCDVRHEFERQKGKKMGQAQRWSAKYLFDLDREEREAMRAMKLAPGSARSLWPEISWSQRGEGCFDDESDEDHMAALDDDGFLPPDVRDALEDEGFGLSILGLDQAQDLLCQKARLSEESSGKLSTKAVAKPFPVVVAETIRTLSPCSFTEFYRIKRLRKLAKSHANLKGTFHAVKAICSEGQSGLRKHLFRFADFVRQRPLFSEGDLLLQFSAYEKEHSVKLRDTWRLAIASFLNMSEEVLQALYARPLPKTSKKVSKNVREKGLGDVLRCLQQEVSERQKNNLDDVKQEPIQTHLEQEDSAWKWKTLWRSNPDVCCTELSRMVLDLAQRQERISFKEFFKFFGKTNVTFLDVARRVLDVVFAEGLSLECNEQNHFLFSFRRQDPPKALVPIEAMIAMHFWGIKCSVRERVLFANTLYDAGYPIQDYQTFCNTLDATCVVCNTPLIRATCVGRVAEFWHSLQGQHDVKSFAEFKRNAIGRRDSVLLDLVRDFNTDILKAWDIDFQHQPNIPSLSFAQRETFLVKVLQEYAKHNEGCHYKILDLFLSGYSDPIKVFAYVMHVAMREKLRITYDKEQQTYTLHEGDHLREPLGKPVKLFIAESLYNGDLAECADVMYALYNAGYCISYAKVQNWVQVITVLCSGQALDVIKRCRPFFKYVFRKEVLRPYDVPQLFGNFYKYCSPLSQEDARFAEGFIHLCDSGDITRKERKEILRTTPRLHANHAVFADFPAPQGSDDAEKDERVTFDDIGEMVCDSAENQRTYFLEDIIPYAEGALSAGEVLEFVMDEVFTHKITVTYTREEESYLFSLLEKRPVPSDAEALVKEYCGDRVCLRADRAYCAYILHRAGHNYQSFQNFAEEFSVMCAAQQIRVEGLEDS